MVSMSIQEKWIIGKAYVEKLFWATISGFPSNGNLGPSPSCIVPYLVYTIYLHCK